MGNLAVHSFIYVIIFSHVEVTSQNGSDGTKRLLLNDPDAISARLSSLENRIAHLENDNRNLRQAQSSGSTYIRWGRNDCSGSNTELVYSGFAAGQSHVNLKNYGDRYGGPSNILCLPNKPEINHTTTSGQSLLYGSEYEDNTYTAGALDEDVPCSLCRSTNTSTSVMIPGRKSCFNGWKLEYHGLLSSNHYAFKASSYVCMDSNPEYLQGGKENKNGNLFYVTSTQCGSLPCPPYEDNTAVNCVVCSK